MGWCSNAVDTLPWLHLFEKSNNFSGWGRRRIQHRANRSTLSGEWVWPPWCTKGRPVWHCWINAWYWICCAGGVHSLSRAPLFATPGTAARQASLSFTISWSLLKLLSIESVRPSNHLILCRPLLLLPSTLPTIIVYEFAVKLRNLWKLPLTLRPCT